MKPSANNSAFYLYCCLFSYPFWRIPFDTGIIYISSLFSFCSVDCRRTLKSEHEKQRLYTRHGLSYTRRCSTVLEFTFDSWRAHYSTCSFSSISFVLLVLGSFCSVLFHFIIGGAFWFGWMHMRRIHIHTRLLVHLPHMSDLFVATTDNDDEHTREGHQLSFLYRRGHNGRAFHSAKEKSNKKLSFIHQLLLAAVHSIIVEVGFN